MEATISIFVTVLSLRFNLCWDEFNMGNHCRAVVSRKTDTLYVAFHMLMMFSRIIQICTTSQGQLRHAGANRRHTLEHLRSISFKLLDTGMNNTKIDQLVPSTALLLPSSWAYEQRI